LGKMKKMLPWLIFAIGCIMVVFCKSTYLFLLLCMIGIYTIAVSGLDLLFGYSGQLSLGQAGFYAIGAYASAILSKSCGIPVWLTMIIGAVIATVIAIVIAFPTVKLVNQFLALVTIAFGQLTFLFVSNAERITQGHSGIGFIPVLKLGPYAFKSNQAYFLVVLALTIIFIIIKQRIVKSRVGRAFNAIRLNTPAANGTGINITYYRVMAFALSAFFAGFAGALYAHLVKFISPESFTISQSILFLTILLFGGTGNVIGPLIGAATLTIITEFFQVIGNYQTFAYGLFLLLIILFLPEGLSGLIKIIKEKLCLKKAGETNDAVE
jgi:branched-chain amino acid transport system permease protein